MPYVYRRPFDYPHHRQAFNLWHLAATIEAIPASASFTTFPATVTAGSVAGDRYSRAVRFGREGIYRKDWRYAHTMARVNLFYTDATEIQAASTSGVFTTYPARVQLGSAPGSTITATVDEAAFTTFPATVEGGRRDPLNDAIGSFETFPATLTRTYGLGQSKVGSVPAKPGGPYRGGRLNVKGRTGIRRSPLKELAKRK